MGGGLIGRDRLPELGRYPEERVRSLFLEALAEK